jgi:serine protease Do
MVKAIFVFMSLLLLAACGSTPSGGPGVPPVAPPEKIDPKAATAYIEVRTPEELRKMFLMMSNDSDFSEPVRSIFLLHSQASGNGSGFVVAQSGGGTFIVTNRHVVDTTDVPMVSFDQGDTQARGKIAYVDEDYDLAVIEITAHVEGLTLQTEYKDMQDVYALGYPGLAGKGSYQATRGSISNRCLDEAKFGGRPGHCFIQHTAPIDPGSSGGPLIDSEGRVVGANVGIVTSNHSVFLAVPAEAVKEALEKAEKIRRSRTDRAWMLTELKGSCHRFLSGLDTTKPDVRQLAHSISYQVVARKGIGALEETEAFANPSITQGFLQDPYSVMRLGILQLFYNVIQQKKGLLSSERCEQVSPSDDVLSSDKGVRIMVRFGDGSRAELTWRFEHGAWKLADF